VTITAAIATAQAALDRASHPRPFKLLMTDHDRQTLDREHGAMMFFYLGMEIITVSPGPSRVAARFESIELL
jgi:hypothetical protein